jgi:hypothetical protein
VRVNSLVENAFQSDIRDVFIKYNSKLSFPVMLDVLMAWLIHNVQQLLPLNKEKFLEVAGMTWDGVEKSMKEESDGQVHSDADTEGGNRS